MGEDVTPPPHTAELPQGRGAGDWGPVLRSPSMVQTPMDADIQTLSNLKKQVKEFFQEHLTATLEVARDGSLRRGGACL